MEKEAIYGLREERKKGNWEKENEWIGEKREYEREVGNLEGCEFRRNQTGGLKTARIW
jgi:hypothetical protein